MFIVNAPREDSPPAPEGRDEYRHMLSCRWNIAPRWGSHGCWGASYYKHCAPTGLGCGPENTGKNASRELQGPARSEDFAAARGAEDEEPSRRGRQASNRFRGVSLIN